MHLQNRATRLALSALGAATLVTAGTQLASATEGKKSAPVEHCHANDHSKHQGSHHGGANHKGGGSKDDGGDKKDDDKKDDSDKKADGGKKDSGTQAAVTQKWGKKSGGDEFAGTAVDESKWERYGDYPGHDGNGQRLKKQDTVADGHLTIAGDAEGNTGGIGWKKGQKYGRWEGRMQVNQKSGDGNPYHPVLILWPDSDKWPDDGELDYAESDAGSTKMKAFLHYGNGSSGGAQDAYDLDHSIDITKWHNYAIEWTPDHIAGYVDGKKWFDDTNSEAQPPGAMHQTIQLDDFFPEGNLNPATMNVDWVRMYDT